MKLLLVCRHPLPLHHGTALRVYHLVRAFTRNHQVKLLTDCPEPDWSPYMDLGIEIKKVHYFSEKKLYPRNKVLAQSVELLSRDSDATVLIGMEMLQYAVEARQAPRVIADVIDDPILAAWRRLWRPSTIKAGIRNAELIIRVGVYERQFIDYVDIFSFVTPQDARCFSARHRRVRVACIPNGVDMQSCKERPQEACPPYAVFVGNLDFVPNSTAVEFLVKRVAPKIWHHLPNVRLLIVGPNPPPWLQNLSDPRVSITGFVPKVTPYLAASRLVVVPMVTGTGIKNKILEAWAAGIPVIATPLACQGLPVRDGENIVIARHADTFAHSFCVLWHDPSKRKRIGWAGRQTVESQFSWDKIALRFVEIIQGR